MRNTERVEPLTDFCGGRIDRGVGAVAGDVHSPAGEDVSDAVELHDHTEERDQPCVFLVARDTIAVERLPQDDPVPLQCRRVLPECPLRPPDDIEQVVDALGLRLGIAHERSPHAPVVRAWIFSEVDETGEGGGFDVGGHGEQRRSPTGTTGFDGNEPASCGSPRPVRVS
jgi:hypothetical protein